VNDILDSAQQSLGSFLPRIVGALFVVLVGLLAARILGRITIRLLAAIGLDRIAERLDIAPLLRQVGIRAASQRAGRRGGAAGRHRDHGRGGDLAHRLRRARAVAEPHDPVPPERFRRARPLARGRRRGASRPRLGGVRVRPARPGRADRPDGAGRRVRRVRGDGARGARRPDCDRPARHRARPRCGRPRPRARVRPRQPRRRAPDRRRPQRGRRLPRGSVDRGGRRARAPRGARAVGGHDQSEDGETVRVPNHLLVDTVVRVGAAPPPGAE
jgi:hypothetical protein